jgi:orotidine-5'-phosphate decarboxylase
MQISHGRDRLLVALDVESGAQAIELAKGLRHVVGGFKIGSRLFTLEGPSLVRALAYTGVRVFLDLKFHDIPNTVAQAVESAVLTGAWMVNVHASGGAAMMEAARRAARETADRKQIPVPLMIAVTVLTSIDTPALRSVGVGRPLEDQVIALAQLTKQAGFDGVVASPLETAAIRAACGSDFVIVTPGIRGAAAGTERNDQVRTLGPAEAVQAGATYIVVGRPIIDAKDPRAAAAAIVEELGP